MAYKRSPEGEARRLAALREALKKRDLSYMQTEEYKAKQRKATQKKWEDGVYKDRAEKTAATRASWTPEQREANSRKISEARKREWAEGKRADMKPASRRRVSKVEYALAPYLEKLGYRHNHDGHTFIGKHVPDFVDIKGRRVFEFYGNFWHQGEDPQVKIDYYKDLGWDCEILWEEDTLTWLGSHHELVTEEQHLAAEKAVVVDKRYARKS